MRTLLLLLILLAAAGCSRSVETITPDPYAISERRLFSAYERFTALDADSAAASERVRYAARRMEEAGLMPALASGFLMPPGRGLRGEPHPGHAHVLGYVPGRNPTLADTLVMVAADLDSPGAAAALETARRLALEALDAQVPERSVLFALFGGPTQSADGIADYLRQPTWATDGIAHVVALAVDSAGAEKSASLLEARGLRTAAVVAPELLVQRTGRRQREMVRQQLVEYAEEVYGRVRALATTPPVPSAETTL